MIAWLAHAYTALGAAAALAAVMAIFAGDFRAAFAWLALQIFIDSTDGLLARALRVKQRLPWFDGARLDDIIDYLTYVFIPVLIVIRADLLPEGWEIWIGSAVLIASGYGFSQADAKVKTTDHFFTGFPSYWNIVALYMFVFRLPPFVNAAVLLVFAVLVFVPLRYVYPSRTNTLSVVTNLLAVVWGILMIVIMWRLPATDGPWAMMSMVFVVYYFALSLWLNIRHVSD